VAAQSRPRAAQASLQGEYEATLSGITAARGTLNLELKDGQYSASLNAASVGVVKLFKSFSLTMSAQGHVVNGTLVPDSYHVSSTSGGETQEVRISFAKGNVREARIVPEPSAGPGRVPPTEAQLRGVLDDLTSLATQAPASGAVATAAACQASMPVFTGWLRFDRKRVFLRMEEEEGTAIYRGPLVVCHVSVAPVAGYTPEQLKEAGSQHGAEVAYAPVAGTRILVPFRITLPTPIGVLTIRATRFVSDDRAAVR